jgi:riboflavin kinase / FMN adenylyltransferase
VDIIRQIPTKEMKIPHPVLAIGNFDGVHLGHQAILKKVVQKAREVKGTSLALTFDPHPLMVLVPERPLYLLTSLKQKTRLIETVGIDRLLCIPFTLEFSEQKPAEFIEKILHLAIGAKEICVGKNFAFGRGREGTAEDMKRIGQSLGIDVSIIEQVRVGEMIVSSSRIRKFLLEGNVAAAAELLGRAYEIEGTVIEGDQRGRSLGFPTANLAPPQELVPKTGVYAVQVAEAVEGSRLASWAGAGYIGSRPTFGQTDQTIEVHLFEHPGELYGKRIRIAFLERVREEAVFSSSEKLVKQIKIDLEKIQRIHEKIAGTKKAGS